MPSLQVQRRCPHWKHLFNIDKHVESGRESAWLSKVAGSPNAGAGSATCSCTQPYRCLNRRLQLPHMLAAQPWQPSGTTAAEDLHFRVRRASRLRDRELGQEQLRFSLLATLAPGPKVWKGVQQQGSCERASNHDSTSHLPASRAAVARLLLRSAAACSHCGRPETAPLLRSCRSCMAQYCQSSKRYRRAPAALSSCSTCIAVGAL